MGTTLKKRQKDILRALAELGGEATTKQIAEKVGLHTNGVAQSLGALARNHVECLGGKGGETKWKLLRLPEAKANSSRERPIEEFLSSEECEALEADLPRILNTPLCIQARANKILERVHDDHEGTYEGRLQFFIAIDGDIHIKTTPTHSGAGFLRFRSMNGGSMSPRTYNALRLLYEAVRLDDLARPIKYPQKTGEPHK